MNEHRFSFSTGALFPLNTEDALQLLADAGFPNAELMPQCLSDASEKSTLLFEKTGVRIASIHYPLAFFPMLYSPHAAMQEDGRKYVRELLTLGKRLGTEFLVVHPHEPSRKGHDELLDAPVVENLRWLAEECEKYGIVVAMENSPKTCATPEQLDEYVKMLGCPNILPMVDTTEVREAAGDPVAFIEKLPPCHLHMSDFLGDTKHLPAGEGDTDWAGVKRALGGDKYKGFYTLEPAYRFYIDDLPAKLKSAYEFLERTFGV